MSRPLGIMPLARQFAELTGTGPNHPRDGTLELQPIKTQVVRLDPRRWNFASQAEMDAAFLEDDQS